MSRTKPLIVGVHGIAQELKGPYELRAKWLPSLAAVYGWQVSNFLARAISGVRPSVISSARRAKERERWELHP